MRDQLNAWVTFETTRTWKQYTPFTHPFILTKRIWKYDHDGQMIFGDLVSLKLCDICLTGEEKPRKNLNQETCPDRGSNPDPLRDRRACYRLLHSGGLSTTKNILSSHTISALLSFLFLCLFLSLSLSLSLFHYVANESNCCFGKKKLAKKCIILMVARQWILHVSATRLLLFFFFLVVKRRKNL